MNLEVLRDIWTISSFFVINRSIVMQLIIEIENDEELKKVESLIASLQIESVNIQSSKQPPKKNQDHCLEDRKPVKKARQDFVKWCRENKVKLSEIPLREERNDRAVFS
jgi:hypothetical protein